MIVLCWYYLVRHVTSETLIILNMENVLIPWSNNFILLGEGGKGTPSISIIS
jgi:hypothetical protein